MPKVPEKGNRYRDIIYILIIKYTAKLFNSFAVFFYEPGGIRTPDPRLRRPLLYPTELQTQIL